MPHSHIACAMLSNSANNGSMNSLPALVKLGANIQCSASDATVKPTCIKLKKGYTFGRRGAYNALVDGTYKVEHQKTPVFVPYGWFTYLTQHEEEKYEEKPEEKKRILSDKLDGYIQGSSNDEDPRHLNPQSLQTYKLNEDCMLYNMSDPNTIIYLASCLPQFKYGAGLHTFPIIGTGSDQFVARKSDKEHDRKLFEAMIEKNLVDGTNIHGWAHDDMLQHSPNNKYDKRNQHMREAVVVYPSQFLNTTVTHNQHGSPTK